VKSVRGLLGRLRGERRPPTGPLTTDETAAAVAREKPPVKEDTAKKPEQER
jgi:hypothetical protein